MGIIEYVLRNGRTTGIKHPIAVSPPEIVFPDTLSISDIKMFVDSNQHVCTISYSRSDYIDPYGNLNNSYKKLHHIFYECDFNKALIGGYIEYFVERNNLHDTDRGYSSIYGSATMVSKNVYAVVEDELLLCIIDGYAIKLVSGGEYSLHEFDKVPSRLRIRLIQLITIHNNKIREKQESTSKSNAIYEAKRTKQKEYIQSILEGK